MFLLWWTLSFLKFCYTSDVTKTLSGVPYELGSETPNALSRIEFVTVTVDNITLSSQFYGDVLGGFEVSFCTVDDVSKEYCSSDGAVLFSGDDHLLAMFEYDIAAGTPTPNISDAGDYFVMTKLFLIGNAFIQLVQFTQRDSGAVFQLQEDMTSPCWMAKAHIDFWIENTIDANDFIYDVEQRAHSLGGGGLDVKFNRPVPQETRSDRDNVPKSQYANKVVGGSFDGLAWAYFKGPSGEQLEIYQIDRTIKKAVGAAYCNRGAVSTAFVDSALVNSNTSRYGWGETTSSSTEGGSQWRSSKNSTSQRLHGLFQYGFRTGDLHQATGFYSEVLGGSLIAYPTQGIEIMRDDSAHWMILANETLEAFEWADLQGITREKALETFGVANISSTGLYRLDHRFILFDNFVVEPLKYTRGLTFGGEVFAPTLNHSSSPAVLGTITAAFGLDLSPEMTSLTEYFSFLAGRLESQGFRGVQLPSAMGSFPNDHPFAGLQYGFLKGPDKEAIEVVLVQDGGRFREALHAALLAAGGVSTMFNDTDAFTSGDMDTFCPYALYDDSYATMQSAAVAADQCETTDTFDSTPQNCDDDDDFSTADAVIVSMLIVCCMLSSLALLAVWKISADIGKFKLQQLEPNTKALGQHTSRSSLELSMASNPLA